MDDMLTFMLRLVALCRLGDIVYMGGGLCKAFISHQRGLKA